MTLLPDVVTAIGAGTVEVHHLTAPRPIGSGRPAPVPTLVER